MNFITGLTYNRQIHTNSNLLLIKSSQHIDLLEEVGCSTTDRINLGNDFFVNWFISLCVSGSAQELISLFW